VLCGERDSYSGIPGQLAEFLGIAPMTFAKEIRRRSISDNQATDESGYAMASAELPALVAVVAASTNHAILAEGNHGCEKGDPQVHRQTWLDLSKSSWVRRRK
jgi:electron transfer flavoprotein alpha/beta subunit